MRGLATRADEAGGPRPFLAPARSVPEAAMPDPRLIAYANLCHAVMTAGLVLWLDIVGEALTGTR